MFTIFQVYHSQDKLYWQATNGTCIELVPNAYVVSNTEGAKVAYLLSSKGAGGIIAAVVLLLLSKNIFNVSNFINLYCTIISSNHFFIHNLCKPLFI